MADIEKDTRSSENLHILFWLIKDSCWLMEYKIVAMLMVIPTIFLAIRIAYLSYKTNYFLPNFAVVCWICANAFWMTCEFYKMDWKTWAIIPFVFGFVAISIFYARNYSSKNSSN